MKKSHRDFQNALGKQKGMAGYQRIQMCLKT